MPHVSIETGIWIVLVVIGVVSSLVSKSKKAVQPRRPKVSTIIVQAMPPTPPAAPEPVVVPPVIAPSQRVKAAAPAPVSRPTASPTHGTPPFRGMFDPGNLVRAMIAAEVLGPPKALQEQSIWSPRHSEPSI
ncbi:MAG TPA: hypothetical protein VFN49_02235 [Candidatus Aquilonibacter sp.]|nr:hypothetical protein [Candidatus Aquilonibacter sp.]